MPPEPLGNLVALARQGDVDAFGRLVRATEAMAFGVAFRVLRETAGAQDVVQDAYVRAFRRLGDLEEPAAFPAWFRRIVITMAMNARRASRRTLLRLDDVPDVPVLDEQESAWSPAQRHQLAQALLTLSDADRRLCDRRYHGGWSTARLARDAGVDEAAMRKRLQRVRDKLRKEMEVTEQRDVRSSLPRDFSAADLSAAIVDLLARPRLTDLPENPVGRALELLREAYADFDPIELPEVVDFESARHTIGNDALYVKPDELHRVDDRRILRYDLTLPLLLTARFEGAPLKLFASGKAYRVCQTDATHLEAFHQAEAFWLDERARLDPWQMTGRVLRSVDRLFAGRTVKIVPTAYPMCSQAWEIEVEDDGRFLEVLAWGVFTDRIVQHLGADPRTHIAIGAGHGLERLAMLRFGIDDARKIEVASVA